jgi:hypothetical protein
VRAYTSPVGLATLIRRHRRIRYRVTVCWPGGDRTIRTFDDLEAARAFADHTAGAGAVAIVMQWNGDWHRQTLHIAEPDDGAGWGDGSAGVREPRRPRPGASSDGIALDLG